MLNQTSKRSGRFVGIAAAIWGLLLIYESGYTLMDKLKVAMMTNEMKTACVGRFLIDLPRDARLSYSLAFLDGFSIAAIQESKDEFEKRVNEREAAINAKKNPAGQDNMEQVTQVDINGFTGKTFVFGRTGGHVYHGEQRVEMSSVALEGYVHSNGTSFEITAEQYNPEQIGELQSVIGKLRVVEPKAIPSTPGFCFGPGMFVDPLPADWTEGVVLFVNLHDRPDIAIAFDTRAGLTRTWPTLLGRAARSDEDMPLWQKPLLKKLRVGHRTINGLNGEEVSERGTELDFTNVYSFMWELPGTENNVLLPTLTLEMSTGHTEEGNRPVTSSLGEEALVALWNRIASSIRLRPTNEGAQAGGNSPPAGPRLGDKRSAGEVCPETGWWQCDQGGNGIRVLGGQRQFLHKGQAMPQALLLPPQTLWEKIRRVQPTLEKDQATAWTLVDRRRNARANSGPSDTALPDA
ncbi:T6SS immunity protein Tli4 family protein [Massilia horti]|uniref:Tle cognate immunity protein 4 C-terminal domain-containing protein n=1 Tax=Massilia horti TaxID=2562153 RepID=A0A4Y9SWP5_9BURK|nr:T6SS immunity protein Tli4 family protein [Massilia horti]TFW30899.1 hypothetical protein E4O92_15280 [Massilia horti]